MNDPEQEKLKIIQNLSDRIAELEEKIIENHKEKKDKEKELDEIYEDYNDLEEQQKVDADNIESLESENIKIKRELYRSK